MHCDAIGCSDGRDCPDACCSDPNFVEHCLPTSYSGVGDRCVDRGQSGWGNTHCVALAEAVSRQAVCTPAVPPGRNGGECALNQNADIVCPIACAELWRRALAPCGHADEDTPFHVDNVPTVYQALGRACNTATEATLLDAPQSLYVGSDTTDWTDSSSVRSDPLVHTACHAGDSIPGVNIYTDKILKMYDLYGGSQYTLSNGHHQYVSHGFYMLHWTPHFVP
jgi:hypothetical protein